MTLATEILAARACRLCDGKLALGPRPVMKLHADARLIIVGQAPGTRVHETGMPYNDRSGDRLRDWLAVDRDTFYGDKRIGILPMGLCYPGVDDKGGDLPPMKICGPTWHPRLVPLLPKVELIVLAGMYGQAYYLRDQRKGTLTETVRAWREYGPRFLPLPHPSWRNTAWLKRNAWFEAEIVPELRLRVKRLLA
jgi:uracil-DNA glycosylase